MVAERRHCRGVFLQLQGISHALHARYSGDRQGSCLKEISTRDFVSSCHAFKGSYFAGPASGLKSSANAFAFGVPTPVTSSQPGVVCNAAWLVHGVPELASAGSAEQSVPKEITSVAEENGLTAPSLERKLTMALTKSTGALLPRICAAVKCSMWSGSWMVAVML